MATPTDTSEPHIDLGATRARQGRYGRHVFWVLVISTLLAAIALFASWGWRSNDLAAVEPNNASQPQDAAAFQAPPPAPKANPAPTPPG
ncbi:MAG: hypothetical protein IT546_02145 [Caulobacteraceae bacterium]|nr:hypothetical protein [Caulobacteraceae bacterium]